VFRDGSGRLVNVPPVDVLRKIIAEERRREDGD
jgi:hypothetical protein